MKTIKIRQIIFIISLVFLILPFGKIFAETANNTKNSAPQKTESAGIQKVVEEKTPAFITRIIEKTFNTTENFRKNTWKFFDDKRVTIQNELKNQVPIIIPDGSEGVDTGAAFNQVVQDAKKGMLEKPIKYLELLFLTAVSAFLKNKIAFYVISTIIIFLIIRMFTKD